MGERNNQTEPWPVKKLSEVCTFSKGKKPFALNEVITKECSIPYINIKAFEKGIITEFTDGEKCNLCNDNDLLMVWDGARCGLIGKAKKGAVGSTLMKILPNNYIHQEYLYHFLSSKFHILNTRSKGVGIPHIEPSLLYNFDLVLPELSVQQVIVSKIEELLSDLENGKQQLQTAMQQLKVYRQSLLKWAFEGKLSPTMNTWKEVNLEEIAFAIDPQPSHRTPPEVHNGIPFVSIKDFNSEQDIIDFTTARRVSSEVLNEHLNRYKLEKGDFVIGKIGTIGKPVRTVLPQVYSLSANIVLIQPRKVNPTYLFYYFRSNLIEKAFNFGMKATSQPAFGIQKVRKLKIKIPDFKTQECIVKELESKLTVCDKLEETITQSLQQSETLKQSILKKAFDGKLISLA
jgi:type I restriction enzyme S subunit